jgi:lysosomal Pro-X carboxypeptidase
MNLLLMNQKNVAFLNLLRRIDTVLLRISTIIQILNFIDTQRHLLLVATSHPDPLLLHPTRRLTKMAEKLRGLFCLLMSSWAWSMYTIDDMQCRFFQQPLNHFLPNSPTYLQRYCIFEKFRTNHTDENNAILFYTGNESPLEQYINQTGFMWELAEDIQATVLFAEHRYEGQSLPNVSQLCMSYSSSKQALADYALLLDHLNPGSRRPVVAFGGSYGGMLSAWMRMKYPNVITAGALAASAPVWGLPRHAPDKLDEAHVVVSRGLQYGYPPTVGVKQNACFTNLLSAWPLIELLGRTSEGRQKLQSSFSLCPGALDHQENAFLLLEWAQNPWFDLAEGSFPYPSSYIPFSLHMGLHKLPAWPVQAACWKTGLHQDNGIAIVGNLADIRYQVWYGDSLGLEVDWDQVHVIHGSVQDNAPTQLLTSVRDAVAIWYNVSQQEVCFNVTPAINISHRRLMGRHPRISQETVSQDPSTICREKMRAEGSWPSLCCNEDMNMVTTLARGMGRDFYWPPSYPRGIKKYGELIMANITKDLYDFCQDDSYLFGYPKHHDVWSKWLDIYYSGLHLKTHSNIIFSNGLLDPWSSAGVYGKDSPSIVSIIIELGGHHTDLMYSRDEDPPCVKKARAQETKLIMGWINDWNSK